MVAEFNRQAFVAQVHERRKILLPRYEAGQSTTKEKLELAVLTYELDDEREAIDRFEEVLREDPDEHEARIWLECISTFEGLLCGYDHKVVVKQAEIVVKSCQGEMAGAALYFKACALGNMDLIPRSEVIEILEESVIQAPGFVGNQHSLASELDKTGKHELACEHYRRALANIVEVNPEWSLHRRIWESTITYRIASHSHRQTIEDRIREIEKLLGK